MNSESDRRLLELLSDGKVDAEIAIRLGISTEDVKLRIHNLMKATGVSTRAELLGLRTAPPRSRLPGRRGRLLAGGLAVAGLLIVAAGLSRSYDSAQRAGPTTNERTTATASNPVSPLPPHRTSASGSLMMSLGQFIAASPTSVTPVTELESRDTMIVARLVDGAVIAPAAGDHTWLVTSRTSEGVTFTRRNDFDQLFLSARVESGGRLAPLGAGVVVESEKAKQPITVFLWVDRIEAGRGFATKIELGNDGAIWLSPESIPLSSAIVHSTGEILRINQATWRSTIFADAFLRISMKCPGVGNPCVVDLAHEVLSASKHLIPAPMAGKLSCREDGSVQLESDVIWTFTLTDSEARRSGGCFEMPTRHVAAGEPMFDSKYVRVSVKATDGSPLSVIGAQDGTIWVGPIFATVGCPCR